MNQETLQNIATTGQTIVSSRRGYLSAVTINKIPAGALKLYDKAAMPLTTGLIATLSSTAGTGTYAYGGRLTNGLIVLNGDAVQGSTVLTSDNTEVSDGDTITIGTTVYRLKSTPAQAFDIKRSGTVDTTLGNIIKAINASGLGDGSDYFAGTTAHPSVTAGTTITSHHFPITAINYGVAGNSIATTTTATHLSFTGSTLASGAEGSAFDVTVAYS